MKPTEIKMIEEIVMNRAEIMLRVHHILISSKLNIVHKLGLHTNPFDDLLQDFCEIVWLLSHNEATKTVMERDKQKWRQREFKRLHGVSVPPNLQKRWKQILIKTPLQH